MWGIEQSNQESLLSLLVEKYQKLISVHNSTDGCTVFERKEMGLFSMEDLKAYMNPNHTETILD